MLCYTSAWVNSRGGILDSSVGSERFMLGEEQFSKVYPTIKMTYLICTANYIDPTYTTDATFNRLKFGLLRLITSTISINEYSSRLLYWFGYKDLRKISKIDTLIDRFAVPFLEIFVSCFLRINIVMLLFLNSSFTIWSSSWCPKMTPYSCTIDPSSCDQEWIYLQKGLCWSRHDQRRTTRATLIH